MTLACPAGTVGGQGMVERVNGTIKNKTILKYKYESSTEMHCDLYKFLHLYNVFRRHGSLRRELDVKTPLKAVYKCRACRRTGYELKPDIFKIKPRDFENDLLNLRNKLVNLYQQRCET